MELDHSRKIVLFIIDICAVLLFKNFRYLKNLNYVSMAVKKALVIFGEGSEDMETVIIVNILRRGNIDVTLASISDEGSAAPVTCSR